LLVFEVLSILFLVSFAVFLSVPQVRYTYKTAFRKIVGQDYCPLHSVRDRERILLRVIHLFAASDLVVIFFCILNTGGSERSFFSPFLFIITPVIILIKSVSRWVILSYGVASVIVFALGLCPFAQMALVPTPAILSREHEVAYSILLDISVLSCTMLPVLFSVMEKASMHQVYIASKQDAIGKAG
jgi:hypothetical protein